MRRILILLIALGAYSSASAVVIEGTVTCEADSSVPITGVEVRATRASGAVRSDTTDASGYYGWLTNVTGAEPWVLEVVDVATSPASYEETYTEAINVRNFTVADHPDCPVGSFCGDGVLDAGEMCDDGNMVDGDGCSAMCMVESFCGDGVLDPGEQCDDGNNINGDGCSAMCANEAGGEGCTPGYWRQPHHFDSYPAEYQPDDLFNEVFDVAAFDSDLTLAQATRLRGGGLNALGRHAVAALLNAASDDVSYDRSVDSVIASFNAAYATGDYEPVKNVFEGFNEQNCPLN